MRAGLVLLVDRDVLWQLREVAFWSLVTISAALLVVSAAAGCAVLADWFRARGGRGRRGAE